MGGSRTAGNYTVYVSPFMVFQNFKYTKHFYIEGQRIVSKLGEMGVEQELLLPKSHAGDSLKNPVKWDSKKELSKDIIIANFEALGLSGAVFTAGKSGKVPYGQIKKYYRNADVVINPGTATTSGKTEDLQFYYHPDHLGSSSYITDISGEVYQHMEYFPFGETFIEERNDAEYTNYLYNGKELDEETGLYYYGARYYDPRTSLWYGVDPLAEKISHWSPYSYAFNCPTRFIDLKGLIPWPVLASQGENSRKITSGMYRNQGGALHGAVDIAFLKNGQGVNQKVDAKVLATHTGIIAIFKDRGKAGNYITITNGNLRTRYLHLQSKDLGGEFKDGDKVQEGKNIGILGQSGTTNPHLHYEIQEFKDGTWERINAVIGDPEKVSYTDDVQLKDPQKILGLPSINDQSQEISKLTYSAPNWAKNSKIGAHIYFFFTGKDSGLPDQYQ